MKVIHRMALELSDEDQTFHLPTEAKIVLCGSQAPHVCLWFEHSDGPREPRNFRVFGTGHNVSADYKHIGSCQMSASVWHIYEKVAS